ncbi:MAG: ferritin-like domain-containing protein [Vicinamibacterales bacterium]
MTSSELVAVLQEFTRDKLALRQRHIAGAERVSNYDFNNTYQYIINREDAQVAWLSTALADVGGAVPEAGGVSVPAEGKGDAAQNAVISNDVRQQQAFVEKWRTRVGQLSNARHRKMLQVVVDESQEHCRFFEQMIDGRADVLGRRTGGESTGGGVLPVRWLQ